MSAPKSAKSSPWVGPPRPADPERPRTAAERARAARSALWTKPVDPRRGQKATRP